MNKQEYVNELVKKLNDKSILVNGRKYTIETDFKGMTLSILMDNDLYLYCTPLFNIPDYSDERWHSIFILLQGHEGELLFEDDIDYKLSFTNLEADYKLYVKLITRYLIDNTAKLINMG